MTPARHMRRWLRRGPWENAASVVIGLGVVMLMQPFSLWLFGHSLTMILIGTIGFVIVSHFPDEPVQAEAGNG
jgi:hypothetical protein